jgi:hypothetical protein
MCCSGPGKYVEIKFIEQISHRNIQFYYRGDIKGNIAAYRPFNTRYLKLN